MPREHINVFDILTDAEGFDYDHYIHDERYILTPRLHKLGYMFSADDWFTSEGDSFGPLIRSVHATAPDGTRVTLWYG